MNWHDVTAAVSLLVSIVVMLGSALGRETVGELKRRLKEAEDVIRVQSDSIAKLQERSAGTTAALARIEEQMVPRAEWEARHRATDIMLERILRRLDEWATRSSHTNERKD